jgi:DNA-binding XRE family transcriptional regulator
MVKLMGNSIKEYIKLLDISKRELARNAGVSHTEINNIINETHIPGVFIAQRIAKILNTTTDDLFWEEKDESKREGR